MKKLIVLVSLVGFFITISPLSSVHAETGDVSKSGLSVNNQGTWKKLSKKKQAEIKQPIPKRYRGTWYAWNVLRKRKERVKIGAQSYEFAFKNAKGKYVTLDKFSDSKLATWKTKYDHLAVKKVLKVKGNKYKFFEENFTLNRTKQGVRVSLPEVWLDRMNHNSRVTFRHKMKKPAKAKYKMTRAFLSKQDFVSAYFYHGDVQYTMNFNKKTNHMLFDLQSIWSDLGSVTHSDTQALMASGDIDAYQDVVSEKFAGNKVTLLVTSGWGDSYYKIQLKRIGREYFEINKIPKKNEWFNGKKVYRTPTLFGKRFVKSHLWYSN
ncbi:hypothetical protein EQG49_08990 [Periweissella cryptocerci]|uniref:DUF3108 domain-containing protein n=1 Tax=Periweissella cryptocerci TaxID=2506420 RepID=A0A4P6YUW9_9LACO|nr:hypothetical protein [Periweissella cryptocerci]QBO36599.1 hypothetical protein EQG49_08990 [Periweissella cryptocerci]